MKIHFILVLVATLVCPGMFGCDRHEVVGLWEFDQAATQKASPSPSGHPLGRCRFKNNGIFYFENSTKGYSIGLWEITPFSEDKIPPHLREVFKEGQKIYFLNTCKVAQSPVHGFRYINKPHEKQGVAYFTPKQQLVLFEPESQTANVYNRIE